jgi:uncharacterized membrane protein YbhN (UPF0104 family)
MRRAYLFTGLAIVLLATWALRGVDWPAVLAVLTQLTPGKLASLLAVDVAITLLFSARWWLILRSQGHRVAYLSLAAYRLAGFAVSYFTPGSQFGGEPLQIHLLRQRQAIPAPAALASVTFDKLLELLANFAFLVVGVAVITLGGLLKGFSPVTALIAAGLLLGCLAAYTAALWTGRTPLGWLLEWLASSQPLLPPAGSRGLHAIAGVVTAAEGQINTLCRQKPRLVLLASALSVLVWVAVIGEFWLCLRFFGASATLPQAITLLTVARLSFLAPLPGGLGAFEAGQTLAFAALGFPPAAAIALSLFIRARDVSLGLFGLAIGARLMSSPGLSVLLYLQKVFPQKRTKSPWSSNIEKEIIL